MYNVKCVQGFLNDASLHEGEQGKLFMETLTCLVQKSQGLTLNRAVIDIGKSENPLGGITYVAISRLKTIDGLYINPMSWERLLQINNKVIVKQRIQEEARLSALGK